MNENAGSACVLSVLIVTVLPSCFSIASHPINLPDKLSNSPNSLGQANAAGSFTGNPIRPLTGSDPTTTPDCHAFPVDTAPQVLQEVSEHRVVEPISPRPVVPVQLKPSDALDHPKISRPVPARSSFTVVQSGETLADVARRVYGTEQAVDILLKANRDQLTTTDRSIAQGTLLRTP